MAATAISRAGAGRCRQVVVIPIRIADRPAGVVDPVRPEPRPPPASTVAGRVTTGFLPSAYAPENGSRPVVPSAQNHRHAASRPAPSPGSTARILVGTLLSAVGRGLTLPFLFIYLTDVRGLSDPRAGLVIGWYGVVTLALSPLGGTLIDRFGARRVVLPCLLVEAVGTGSLALVSGTASAFAVITLIAIGSSAIWPGQNTILASLTDRDEQQRVFGMTSPCSTSASGSAG
ncbi:MFS transporter [Micromonospora rubida]|uniref:MFS transporter n=1 Tax=Micromonospora rubida TaxID=2697657 RepID=UPI002E2841EC|nr:MFS transporter [Micromonospora rubida]